MLSQKKYNDKVLLTLSHFKLVPHTNALYFSTYKHGYAVLFKSSTCALSLAWFHGKFIRIALLSTSTLNLNLMLSLLHTLWCRECKQLLRQRQHETFIFEHHAIVAGRAYTYTRVIWSTSFNHSDVKFHQLLLDFFQSQITHAELYKNLHWFRVNQADESGELNNCFIQFRSCMHHCSTGQAYFGMMVDNRSQFSTAYQL